mgnify:FL=1
MARNRVIYQSEALYSSESVQSRHTGVHAQLCRVQSANYNFNITRQDVNQFGQLARIDSIVLEPPTVGLDFTYYPTDGFNERILNFAVQTGKGNLPTDAGGALVAADGTTGVSAQVNFASGHMETSSGRNFYIVTAAEGNDAVGVDSRDTRNSVIGIGNAFVSDYTLDVAVGSLPTVSVTMEGSNMIADTAVTGNATTANLFSGIQMAGVNPEDGSTLGGTIALPAPSENPGSTLSAIRPGDVTFDIGSFHHENSLVGISGDSSSIHVQSASISLPLSRTPLQRLGSKFAFARVVDFPIVATMTVNGVVNELQQANLHEIIDQTETHTVSLTMKDTDGNKKMVYTLKGCRLESQSFSSSIGSDKTVDMTFTTQVGGPQDTTNGIFLSGATRSSVFIEGADVQEAGSPGGFPTGTAFFGGTGLAQHDDVG